MSTYSPEAINAAATWPLLVGSAFAFAAALVYGIGSPWYRSRLGAAFLGIIIAASIVAVPPVGRRLFSLEPYPFYEWVAFIAYTLHAIAWAGIFFTILRERRRAPVFTPPLHRRESTMSDSPRPAYPWQRVARTILVNAIVAFPVVNATLPLVAEAFNRPDVPGEVVAWVNVAIGAALVVTGVGTRILAIPAVNSALTKLGLGAAPRSEAGHVGDDVA